MTFVISEWKDTCDIDELSVAPLQSSIRDKLVANGRNFVKYAIGPHYLYYTAGSLFRKHMCGKIHFKVKAALWLIPFHFSR